MFSVQPAPYYCESDFSFDSYGLSNLDIWSNQPIYFIFGQIKPPQNGDRYTTTGQLEGKGLI